MSVSTEASVSMGNAVGLYVEMGVEKNDSKKVFLVQAKWLKMTAKNVVFMSFFVFQICFVRIVCIFLCRSISLSNCRLKSFQLYEPKKQKPYLVSTFFVYSL